MKVLPRGRFVRLRGLVVTEAAGGIALLNDLKKTTHAVQRGPAIVMQQGAGASAWRIRQPPHRIDVAPLADHLIAIHLNGHSRVAGRFAGEPSYRSSSRPGQTTFLPGGCGWLSEVSSPIDFVHLLVSPTQLAAAADSLNISLSRLNLYPRLAASCREMEHAGIGLGRSIDDGGLPRLTSDLLLLEASLAFVRWLSHANGLPRQQAGLTPTQQRRTLQFLEENVRHNVSLRMMAEAVGISPFHFARCFTKSFGVSPHRYVISLRVERAKQLLRLRNGSLSEIAVLAGFDSQQAMTKTFRRVCGFTPGEFRAVVR